MYGKMPNIAPSEFYDRILEISGIAARKNPSEYSTKDIARTIYLYLELSRII